MHPVLNMFAMATTIVSILQVVLQYALGMIGIPFVDIDPDLGFPQLQ
jgi:hypothetical protein